MYKQKKLIEGINLGVFLIFSNVKKTFMMTYALLASYIFFWRDFFF